MSSNHSRPDDLRLVFQSSLIDAIAAGRDPEADSVLGPATKRAIAAIARAHPEASTDSIVMAYEAFDRERTDLPRAATTPSS